jgi:hypothetical protein
VKKIDSDEFFFFFYRSDFEIELLVLINIEEISHQLVRSQRDGCVRPWVLQLVLMQSKMMSSVDPELIFWRLEQLIPENLFYSHLHVCMNQTDDLRAITHQIF